MPNPSRPNEAGGSLSCSTFSRIFLRKFLWIFPTRGTIVRQLLYSMDKGSASHRGGRVSPPASLLNKPIASGSRGSSRTTFSRASGMSGVGDSPEIF